MLKKVYPIIIVLVVLAAAVGGYLFRPWIDLRFVDYPMIQESALYGVQTYEYVAERLADYPDYWDGMEHVVLEYSGTATKIEDARLREVMCCDWRYILIEELESEIPIVRVINVKADDGVATIQLYFSDGDEGVPSSEEILMGRLEVTALVVQLMAEQYPDHLLDVQWITVKPYQCLGGQCVRATVGIGIKAPADVYLKWAASEDLGEALYILEDGGAEVFVDSMWTPWIYVEEELPRVSDDLAPWDWEEFYED